MGDVDPCGVMKFVKYLQKTQIILFTYNNVSIFDNVVKVVHFKELCNTYPAFIQTVAVISYFLVLCPFSSGSRASDSIAKNIYGW